MRVDLLDYELPPERIAQKPPESRDGGRLLVVEPRGADAMDSLDAQVIDLADHLPPRALLVVNDTRVIAARLFAKKPETGGKVEIFLVRFEGEQRDEEGALDGEVWRALGKSSKPLRFGMDLVVGDDLSLRILGRADDDGLLRVLLTSEKPIAEVVAEYGHVPLPPYIKRADEADDEGRYQTIFAKNAGAIAAPTAGLHLSSALLGKLAIAGFELATVTLHVGLGTFQPVQVEDLDAHPMHAERFVVSRAAARTIAAAKREGRPIVAVGTTVVRTLEAAAELAHARGEKEPIVACEGETRLLIQPGYSFRVVDALLTNFHLPKSTLLALVAAFVGLPNLKRAYAHAIAAEYRFFSYGDAMLVKRALPTSEVLGALAQEGA